MSTTVPIAGGRVAFRPANEVRWTDIDRVFGDHGVPGTCHCQWLKSLRPEFTAMSRDEQIARLRQQTGCDDPEARDTTGVLAYLGDEPVGWVAVEPRPGLVRLRNARVPWTGRHEDKDDDAVWAIGCFVVRPEFQRRGISHALVVGAVEHARRNGAAAVEGYPLELPAGQDDVWGELFVGVRAAFVAAGFTEVTHPTARRYVMRLDL
jgi:GNAT superfamily N-acetyltransferase